MCVSYVLPASVLVSCVYGKGGGGERPPYPRALYIATFLLNEHFYLLNSMTDGWNRCLSKGIRMEETVQFD